MEKTAEEKQRERTLFKIRQKVKKAIFDFGLIRDGDRILIGLSGGKDSLALTELLGERQKIQSPKFSLVAAHVSLTNIPYQSDILYLSNFCEKQHIEFEHVMASFSASGDEKKDSKSPCFFCSWNRRKALFETAKNHGCNKIALGHHQDDILETFLLNMTFQGSLGTMPPLLKMNRFDMEIIRPLCLLQEKDLVEMNGIRGYKKQEKNCPYEKISHRSDMKTLLTELDKLNPHARQNIWGAMMNVMDEYLPKKMK